jgi:hypothetical protein
MRGPLMPRAARSCARSLLAADFDLVADLESNSCIEEAVAVRVGGGLGK